MEMENVISVANAKILFLEPFYGGSHKALIDTITKCSSVLNLSEMLGLRPDLQSLKKVVYFHENQLIYPVRDIKQRDVQYAYNQITTCLSADIVMFNSNFNKETFLKNIQKVIKMLPDFRPKDVASKIEGKSYVVYFPMKFPHTILSNTRSSTLLHIVWPHRWEFDKNPDDFFTILYRLKDSKMKFQVSVLGESFTDNPPVFQEARDRLKDEIVNFGFIDSKDSYYDILSVSHVVVSTAKHEFFGVSMLEATYLGCFPLAPNDLVYPELYPHECLYSTPEDLYIALEKFCKSPLLSVESRKLLNFDFGKFSSDLIVPNLVQTLNA